MSAGEYGPAGLRIFLNYRREDAADAAGRLFDALAAHFGNGHVFMDIDAIEPGVDFETVVNEAVGNCDVLLAVIGRQWLTVTDARGRRRLDNPDDYVRMELQAALERDVRVIPVLVQGVDMPSSDELPDALGRLARRNALEISTTRWRYDIGRLTAALERIGETSATQQVRAENADSQLERLDEEHGKSPRTRQRAPAAEPAETKGTDSQSQPPASLPGRSRNRMAVVLAAIVVVVGVAVGALAGSGAFSPGRSTLTITSASGAVAGSNTPTAATAANTPTATTGSNTPTATAAATSTTTVSAASGSLPQHCGNGIDTTQSISCALANNVFYEYYTTTHTGGDGTALSAWSPVTNKYYDFSCSVGTDLVKCAISGTTDPNAEVDLAQAALSVYTPQQAISYAANADVGPNG